MLMTLQSTGLIEAGGCATSCMCKFVKTKLYSVNCPQPETVDVLTAETDLLIQKRSSVHRASLNLLELKRGRKCLTPVEGKLQLFQKCQGWEYQASDFYAPLMVCCSYASISHFLWIIIWCLIFVLIKKAVMLPLLNTCCRLHPPHFFSVPLLHFTHLLEFLVWGLAIGTIVQLRLCVLE